MAGSAKPPIFSNMRPISFNAESILLWPCGIFAKYHLWVSEGVVDLGPPGIGRQ